MDKAKLTFGKKLATLGLDVIFGSAIYFNTKQDGFFFKSKEKSKMEKIVLDDTEFLGVGKEGILQHMFTYEFFSPPVKIDSPKTGDNFRVYRGMRYKNNVGFLGYIEYRNGKPILKDTSKAYRDTFMILYGKFLEN